MRVSPRMKCGKSTNDGIDTISNRMMVLTKLIMVGVKLFLTRSAGSCILRFLVYC